MPRSLDPGFIKADSTNLPKVDEFMVFDYLTKDDRFNAPESRNVKLSVSSRESYGNSAIGYVCLQRLNEVCIVKAQICPEHRVRSKDYKVILKINEKERVITELLCQDCAVSQGGCKHAIAFLMFVHRCSESPSVTENECYWRKPKLSAIGTNIKYVEGSEMLPRNVQLSVNDLPDNSTFLRCIMEQARQKKIDSQISRYHFELDNRKVYFISMHNLIYQYEDQSEIHDFVEYARSQMSEELCYLAELLTRNQSECLIWFELRYGRCTGSKLNESSHCETSEGSLVRSIVGVTKKFDNIYMARGRRLEEKVLTEVSKKLKCEINKVGLLLSSKYPILGASPDGIGNDFVVEVKCPSSEKNISNYLSNGKIQKKFEAQIMFQMLLANKNKGYFCIADPNFEKK